MRQCSAQSRTSVLWRSHWVGTVRTPAHPDQCSHTLRHTWVGEQAHPDMHVHTGTPNHVNTQGHTHTQTPHTHYSQHSNLQPPWAPHLCSNQPAAERKAPRLPPLAPLDILQPQVSQDAGTSPGRRLHSETAQARPLGSQRARLSVLCAMRGPWRVTGQGQEQGGTGSKGSCFTHTSATAAPSEAQRGPAGGPKTHSPPVTVTAVLKQALVKPRGLNCNMPLEPLPTLNSPPCSPVRHSVCLVAFPPALGTTRENVAISRREKEATVQPKALPSLPASPPTPHPPTHPGSGLTPPTRGRLQLGMLGKS